LKKGYMGKILWVNLDTHEIKAEILDEKLARGFLGGYGLGARILFTRQRCGVDALGAENTLGFLTGPLTGTKVPACGRFTVVGKSPLTGTWGDANCGGDFGPYLKFSGYDAVFFSGSSDKPVYLLISDGKAELKDAGHLWGKDTHATEDMLKAEFGKDVRVACIGGAGEKLSLISGVINSKGRAAARSGLGAVMGSKKVKALAVRGKRKVPVADAQKLDDLRKQSLLRMKENPWYPTFHNVGTDELIPDSVTIGRTPVKNWAGSITDMPDVAAIGGKSLIKHQTKRYACWGCPIGCGGSLKAGKTHKYPAGVHKPEYETVGAFGTMCLNSNLESIIMANEICNRHGLDTISAGSTLAFAIECYENGIISKRDTDGIELTWGNHQAIVAMTEKMAKRKGFGDILADGVRAASEKIGKGAEKFAVHIQGQEPPMHDPRAQIRLGLGATYQAAPTPARHTRGSGEGEFRHPDQGSPPYDLDSFQNRGEEHKRITGLLNVASSAGMCLFGYIVMPWESLPKFISHVTGWDITNDEVETIGERIANMQHAFNIREGLNPVQFKVPSRLYKAKPPYDGPIADRTCDIELLVKDWYKEMDWDVKTGKPSKRKLEGLDLKDVAEALYP
jgi:aldehyde:ferredoxin oxidoreductase